MTNGTDKLSSEEIHADSSQSLLANAVAMASLCLLKYFFSRTGS